MDGPIDPPEAPDIYRNSCWPCKQGRCEDCVRLGKCSCCEDRGHDEVDE